MDLIPCAKCGQAVGDYRAACPFCGASTGRPEGAPTPEPAPTPQVPAAATTTRSMAYILIVVAVLAAAGVGVIWAQSSWRDSATQANDAYQGAQQALDQNASTLTTVFSWPGGGPSNDIRNSAPFQLQGGHQRVTVSSSAIAGEYNIPSQGWTIESADGSGVVEWVNPATFGTTQSDCYLPTGSYYLSSNTIDCAWTVTVSEVR